MDFTTLKLYYNSKPWGDISLLGFQLLESIQDTDDELLLYINNGLSKILPNGDNNPKLATYYLNLFRATTIWFKEYIEPLTSGNEYDVFSYSTIVEKELKHVLITDEIKEEDCPNIAKAIMYAVYVYYTIYDSDNLMLRRKIVCKDVPKHLEEMFPHNYIDNFKCYRYFDKHILYCNYNTLSLYLTHVIGEPNGLFGRHDEKAVESYCRKQLPIYKSFLEEKPCNDFYLEDELPVFVYSRSSFLSNDLSASLFQCARILEERIELIELGNKEYENNLIYKHPSIEEILKDYPKLAEAKRDILVALEKGYIEYTPGKTLHQPGLLTPRIGTSEPSFPSKTAFVYFIGHSLRIDGERKKRFPASQVASLFVIGTEDTVGTSWRQLSPSTKMKLEQLYNTIID